MKEFMMIFIGGDYETGELSPEEMQRRMLLWDEWVTALREKNLFLDGRALKNTATQVSGEKDKLVTDGPFVETKELVTGYFVVKANNREEVAQYSNNYPDYDLGGRVEIREIETFE